MLKYINSNDYGEGIFDGMHFQENLEKKAYELGCGFIPVQMYKSFKSDVLGALDSDYTSCFKGEYSLANLNEIFPSFINNSLKEGIDAFNKKIPGFENSLLAGVESRSSSPVRIVRDSNFNSNIKNIYPCGEGAGYAGGIITSCIDGIKVAEAIFMNNSNE